MEGVIGGEHDPDLEIAQPIDLQGEVGTGPRAPVRVPNAAVVMPPRAVIGAHPVADVYRSVRIGLRG